MPTRRKRATIREVAEATGLSPAAVSYALRGIQTSEETQQRVRRAAAELGYEAHPIARALASGRTGMVVQPLDPAAQLWAELAEALPVVSIGDGLRGGRAHGEVVFDNRRGVTLALEHLHGLGHRHVAVLTPTRDSTPDRPADVYVNAEAERLGLGVSVVPSHQTLPAATEVAREVLSRRPRPTAVFCFTDSIAYGVYAATRKLGLAVPGDVSVAGYDDHPMSALLTPPLTSVDWDMEGIVHAAVRVVVGAIEGKPRKRRIMCEPNLRRRDSTGPPPTAL